MKNIALETFELTHVGISSMVSATARMATLQHIRGLQQMFLPAGCTHADNTSCACPDGVMYWEDVTETLSAFVEAFPPGAGLIMQSKGALAAQLASVHDSLLPEIHASLASKPAADTVMARAHCSCTEEGNIFRACFCLCWQHRRFNGLFWRD